MTHRINPLELAQLAAPILSGLVAQNAGNTGPNLRSPTQLAGEAVSLAVELHAAAVAEFESKREPPPPPSAFANSRY
jgi:hypothetical protein